ncbi:isochorismatase family protein [Actinocorallia populi]|uniref:isochorismatase family protein n=1 Tax=Actinocorallia populi TaxID=2079200 RepID=UPI000D08852F|nr:isochorismatase family protein [Actinocorallia populi]
MTAPRRALIVIDAQQEYFDGPLAIRYPSREATVAAVVEAVNAAVAAGIPVVAVQHTGPDGSPVFAAGSAGWRLHPDVEDAVRDAKKIEKRFSSVFPQTGLAEWLRDQGVDTVTFAGYMTNNCDLASVVDAEALGFGAEVLSDATGAIHLANAAGSVSAEDLHRTLMVLFQSNLAAVATTGEWRKALASGAALEKDNLVASALEGLQRNS